jgi:hypothetical protein
MTYNINSLLKNILLNINGLEEKYKIFIELFGLFYKLLYICHKIINTKFMQEQELSPKESLRVINEMIETSKSRINEDGFIYLFWGWLILLCALAQFVLFQVELYEYSFIPYLLVIPAGIYTGFQQSKKHRKEKGNYVSNVMKALWITLGINLALFGFLIFPAYQVSPIPIILAFLAIGAIVSGGTVKFKPLIYGGIICNLIAIAALFTPTLYQPLLLAGGMIAADLVPGYIIRNQYKKQNA